MELDGMDELLANLNRMYDEIDDDLDEVVKNNTIELTEKVQDNERKRFDKGYWTGHTFRHTVTDKLGPQHYRTLVGSDYSAYLEFGTRYYDGAVHFLYDMYFKQKQIFLSDLEKLVER